MKKNILNWSLTAAILCGLSLSFTACSDDDDKDKTDEQEQTVMPQGVDDDATVLGSLLSEWVEDFQDEVNVSILSKQYEATIGEVEDASQQTVRTMVVGTQEHADSYAKTALGVLGINDSNLNGFSWQNAAVGSVAYRHGTGNELGVITVNIKQLPGLTRLRLVKDFEGNAPAVPYYQKGDIVKYTGSGDNKDRYFICLNDHEGGANATWVSFDCGEQINKLHVGTCSWLGKGNDIYYDKEQVKSDNMAIWLKEFLLSDEGYNRVISHMQGLPLTAINQIVPSSQQLRNALIDSLIFDQDMLMLGFENFDYNVPGPNYGKDHQNYDFENDEYDDEDSNDGDEIIDGLDDDSDGYPNIMVNGTPYKTLSRSGNTEVRCYFPTGLLLTDVARWSMGLSYKYWVPYIVLVDKGDLHAFQDILEDVEGQYLYPGHFKWEKLASDIPYDGNEYSIDKPYNGKEYSIYRVAFYWTHGTATYEINGQEWNFKNLVDFTQHRKKLKNEIVDLSREADLDWTLRNITSRELKVKDKGQKYKYFETVYRGKE